MSSRKQPVVGQKYNHLTVLRRDENYVSPKGIVFSKWLCQCDCGNVVSVLGSSLVTNHTKSCGCLSKRYKVDDSVMLGKRFGMLTVVSRAPSHKVPSGSVYDMWNCVCDCGRTTVSFGRNLRIGATKSCGCDRIKKQAMAKRTSKAELWTKQYFHEHGITFEYQWSFLDLVGSHGGLLSYDFYISDCNMLLELNGLQHYVAIDWFGGASTLEDQQINDLLKKYYAVSHGYNFVVIDTNRVSQQTLYRKLNTLFSGFKLR